MIQWDSCHPSLQSSRYSFKKGEDWLGRTSRRRVEEGELKNEWLKLATGLQCVSSFTVSRCYFQEVTEKIVSCSLHGFGDASSKAYAAVIYLHVTTTTGSYVKFLASRSRVALVKQEMIPRLELLAAFILARLIGHVGEALEPEVDITYLTCWTDSKVALAWIKGEQREWKPFIQNRMNTEWN